jgi:pimeloyl-ACP methyl ester carboxylesterase
VTTTVRANNLDFAYLEWGKGPLVLLFHGFPDTAHTWDVIGPRLSREGYHVVAPFMRGYAPSGIPTTDTSSRTLGEDVIALIAAFKAETARIIGHDWGAEAVYAAAHLAPNRIHRMVPVGIPHRTALPYTPKTFWGARHFFTLRLPWAQSYFARNNFSGVEVLCQRWSPTWKATEEDHRPVKEAFAQSGSLHAALGYYRGLSVRTPTFMRSPIQVPTLCVAGTDDPNVTPADFEAARRVYAGKYEVAAIGGGHFCHRESPDAFLKAVIPFLE